MKKTISFLLLCFVFGGCVSLSSSVTGRVVVPASEWYSKKIGVLSALNVSGTKFAAANANPIFRKVLYKRYKDVSNRPKIDNYRKVTFAINNAQLFDDFVKIQKSYSAVKILDSKRLQKIGMKLGYDYFIVPFMLNDSSYTVSGSSYVYFTTQIQVVIFDVRNGIKVGAILATGKDRTNWLISGGLAVAYEKAFKAAVERLY